MHVSKPFELEITPSSRVLTNKLKPLLFRRDADKVLILLEDLSILGG